MMTRILLVALLVFQFEILVAQTLPNPTYNPNLIPIPIDCWGLNQSSIQLQNSNLIKHYSCLIAPAVGSFNINGIKEVDFMAGKEVHLKPGFTVNNLNGNGYFHASIEIENISIAVFTPNTNFGEVEKCEKLELGVKLPQLIKDQINNYFQALPHDQINPFDPDDISIEAVFTTYAPSNENLVFEDDNILSPPLNSSIGVQRKIFGFYYEEYHTEYPTIDGNWVGDTTSFNFRIRFSPNVVGLWRTDIIIKIDNQIVYSLKPFYFNCTPSNSPGFIIGGETTLDKRHFIFENGDVFFGIGQNIAWPDNKVFNNMPPGHLPPRTQAPYGYDELRVFLKDLNSNGGNFFRYMSAEWTDALEWEKLGDYKAAMTYAWEFDRTFDLIKEKEMYILWAMQTHTSAQYKSNNQFWDANPYHTQLGLNNIESFFTNPDAIKYIKRRLRYMMSRWGYSSQITGLQPFNEINEIAKDIDNGIESPYFTSSNFRNNFHSWFQIIKQYIQDDLGYNFNFGTSFTSELDGFQYSNPTMALADFNDWHGYDFTRNRNLNRWYNLNGTSNGYRIFDQYKKPFVLGEFGFQGHSILYDCKENDWHNDLWASAMMGGFSTGLHWFLWKGEHNTRENFVFVKDFFDTHIDFKNIKWEPQYWPGNNIGVRNIDINDPRYDKKWDNYFEALYMTGDIDDDYGTDKRAFGWVHNRSSYWYNKTGPCEVNIMWNANNNSDPYDDLPFPNDDDNVTNVETQDGHSNRKNRNIRINNMKNFQRFDMVWYDPLHGGTPLASTSATHGIGAFTIQLPDQINWTTYHDLVFLMSPNNSSFYSPGPNSEATEIFVLSNEEELENDSISKLTNNFPFEIFVYPNPTADNVKIECIEKINRIEICNIMGDKLYEVQVNANYGDIDMTVLSKGVYIFKTITVSKTYINKIVYQ